MNSDVILSDVDRIELDRINTDQELVKYDMN